MSHTQPSSPGSSLQGAALGTLPLLVGHRDMPGLRNAPRQLWLRVFVGMCVLAGGCLREHSLCKLFQVTVWGASDCGQAPRLKSLNPDSLHQLHKHWISSSPILWRKPQVDLGATPGLCKLFCMADEWLGLPWGLGRSLSS